MPMNGIVPGSETEAALKDEGLYIPDILVDTMRDKLGMITARLRKYAAKHNEILSSMRVRYDERTGKNEYTAAFTLPYNQDVTTEDETYKAFVQRFKDAADDTVEEFKIRKGGGVSKKLNILWERMSDSQVAIDSDNFDDLMKATFDLQINPMIKAANEVREPHTNYQPVQWKQLMENDAKGLYNPPSAIGLHTAAQLQRRADHSEDGHSK